MAANRRRVRIGMSNHSLTQNEYNSIEGSLDDISVNGTSLILSVSSKWASHHFSVVFRFKLPLMT